MGFEAALLAAPDQRTAVVVMANRQSRGGAQRLGIDLIRAALGVSEPATLETSQVPIAPEVAAAVSGDYKAAHGPTVNLRSFGLTGGRVRVWRSGDALFMRGRLGPLRSPVQLRPMDPEDPFWFRFVLRDFAYHDMPLDVAFGHDSRGRISRLAIGLVGSRFDRMGA